ncbi:MAG: 3-phosphoglycerate dehydrogenase family protein [Pseudomonadota bacterium]
MYRILKLNNIAATGLAELPHDRYEIGTEISQPDGILVRSTKMHDMELPASLKAVARAGAGVNNIPVEALTARGIPVFNAPGANANAVKELVLAGMLLACRNVCPAWDYARQLDGDDDALHRAVEAGKKQFAGFELPGRTLGIVGLGAIGVQVANAALALGMRVIGHDPTITVERAWQLSAQVEQAGSVDEVVAAAEFITFHVPLIPSTRHLLNEARLQRMRKGAVVLNFARQGIVDDEAALRALDDGPLYGYVCDFPTVALNAHPRVVALPHLGASTTEAESNCAVMVAQQLRDYLEHGNVRNSVNFPSISLPRGSERRLAVVHQNQPDMVGQLSHHLGEARVNIVRMLNESRDQLACTIIDVDGELSESLLDALAAVPGVLSLRVL